MQQEVERAQIGQLEPLHVAGDHAGEVAADAIERELLGDEVVPLRPERDHPHVGGVALVAGSGMRDVHQAHLHASTSTLVCTTVLSTRAGQ